MIVQENVSLKPFNTFGVDATATLFVSVSDQEELQEILLDPRFNDPLFIGGGSNMLLVSPITKPVIHLNIQGIQIIKETKDTVLISVGAGVTWHKLVLWSLEKNYGGIENLALIPGNTGTAPIQNIGAYGVEIKDVFHSLTAVSLKDRSTHIFSKEDCEFGYRDSKFKNEWAGKYVITTVRLVLHKTHYQINTSYGDINKELARKNINTPSIKDVAEAVICIRNRKLPDPKVLGNSGSFFKNPIVTKTLSERLVKKYPEMPFYKFSENSVKIPAGWLIEKAGFKGMRHGNVGMHAQQALVLVNYGGASGKELLEFAQKVKQTVEKQFEITLETEVNIIK